MTRFVSLGGLIYDQAVPGAPNVDVEDVEALAVTWGREAYRERLAGRFQLARVFEKDAQSALLAAIDCREFRKNRCAAPSRDHLRERA